MGRLGWCVLGGNINDNEFVGLTVILLAFAHSTVVHSVTYDLYYHAKLTDWQRGLPDTFHQEILHGGCVALDMSFM